MAWTNSSVQFYLTGYGVQTVGYYEAWSIFLNSIPAWASSSDGPPRRYYGLGWIAFGTANFGTQYARPVHLLEEHFGDIPRGCNRLSYNLAPGVEIGGLGLTWV